MDFMNISFSLPVAVIFLVTVITTLLQILNRKRVDTVKTIAPPQAKGAWPMIGHLHLLGGSRPPHKILGDMAEKWPYLYGPLPKGKQFNTFQSNSYIGNPRLCEPLSRQCQDSKASTVLPPTSYNKPVSNQSLLPSDIIDWIVISLGVVIGLVVGIILGRSQYATDRLIKRFETRKDRMGKATTEYKKKLSPCISVSKMNNGIVFSS
ncbi:leucine-rich repeat protein [Artemisia annua]|uniref:Leucine-rich repeat protein n=1 Tax=Artemisia annua TaxID=35608 RepID=A0A2U1MK53_ARTAN|nr:leucine-rich repeat protein [Artemisia annua]